MEPFRVDVDMNYAPPAQAELDRYQLRAVAMPKALCNGQLLVRLYGERADLEQWLDECYEDDDHCYRGSITPTLPNLPPTTVSPTALGAAVAGALGDAPPTDEI